MSTHGQAREVDVDAAQAAVRALLMALGEDPTSPSLQDTPARVAGAFEELLSPRAFDLTSFPNDEGYDELVLVRDIPFASLCEHHLLPFTGVAHVAYIPGQRILGLSKLARVVELFSRRLQVQERLTAEVADCICEHLQPKGVAVVIEATHACMTARGVNTPGVLMTTSRMMGTFRSDERSRKEVLALMGKG